MAATGATRTTNRLTRRESQFPKSCWGARWECGTAELTRDRPHYSSSDHPRRSTSRESEKHNSRKNSPAESASTHSSKRRRVSPEGAAVVTAHDEPVEREEPELVLAPAEPEPVPMDTEQDQEVEQVVEPEPAPEPEPEPEPEVVGMEVEPEVPAVEPEVKVPSRAPSPAQAKDPEPVSTDDAEEGALPLPVVARTSS